MISGFFNYPKGEKSFETSFAQPVRVANSEVATSLFYHLEPKTLDDWFDQFLKIIVIAQKWKSSLPLVEWVNSQQIDLTGRVSADEIQEVVEELNAQSFNIIKFLSEWTDALNPLAGLVLSLKLDIDYQHEVFRHVDGQGQKSDVYARAEEISLNLASVPEKLIQDIREIYILMLSALKHAPPFTADLTELALIKIASNIKNYPPELFSVLPENEEVIRLASNKSNFQPNELDPAEKDQKYTHVIKCLKWLRSLELERKLPEDWRLVKSWILAFRSSDESLRMLQTEWFKIHPEKLVVEKPVLVYQAGGSQT